jgi:hypothetical protein
MAPIHRRITRKLGKRKRAFSRQRGFTFAESPMRPVLLLGVALACAAIDPVVLPLHKRDHQRSVLIAAADSPKGRSVVSVFVIPTSFAWLDCLSRVSAGCSARRHYYPGAFKPIYHPNVKFVEAPGVPSGRKTAKPCLESVCNATHRGRCCLGVFSCRSNSASWWQSDVRRILHQSFARKQRKRNRDSSSPFAAVGLFY